MVPAPEEKDLEKPGPYVQYRETGIEKNELLM